MFNSADDLPFLISTSDDFEVEITVRSLKYDCHTAYRLNKLEINDDNMSEIVRCMTYRLKDFIDTRNQQKKNTASKDKDSPNEKGFLN